jgi:hypothetical protein
MTALVAGYGFGFALTVIYITLRETWKARRPFVIDPRPCRV